MKIVYKMNILVMVKERKSFMINVFILVIGKRIRKKDMVVVLYQDSVIMMANGRIIYLMVKVSYMRIIK